MVTKNTYKIDIENELESIEKDINEAEEAGLKQITLDYFAGAENEREFILAARKFVKELGWSAVHEYDGENGELLLIIRKTA